MRSRSFLGHAVLVGAVLAAGCSPATVSMAADHPAQATAPVGRLAGPPPALQAGVRSEPATPPAPAADGAAGAHGGHGGGTEKP